MKGQRLYVREAHDLAEIIAISRKLGAEPPRERERGWIGFLAGTPVTIAFTSHPHGSTAAELQGIYIPAELRRKRVGTSLLRQIEQALRGTVIRLDVRKGVLPDRFLEACGYAATESRFSKILSAEDDG